MSTPDRLLQLIMQLQRERSIARGRKRLLNYMRTCSQASYVALFALEPEEHLLMLLAFNGEAPTDASARVPAGGSFERLIQQNATGGAVDLTQLLDANVEERSWCWPEGEMRIQPVRLSPTRNGLIIYGFQTRRKVPFSDEQELEMRLCNTLLPMYLQQTRPVRPKTRPGSIPLEEPEERVELTEEQKQAVERERERIARDIHDGPAQNITLALLRIEYLQRTIKKAEDLPEHPLLLTGAEELEKVHALLQECVEELRHTVYSPQPTSLEQKNIAVALENLIGDFRSMNPEVQVSFVWQVTGLQDKMPAAVQVPVYRFIQEALNNVSKHAQASRVTVSMRIARGSLIVEVRDNGRGISPETLQKLNEEQPGERPFGLQTMRERIENAGGHFEILSQVGEGTIVRARFPVRGIAAGVSNLTEREQDVLRLVVDGLSNRAIAERLSISIDTVKSHIHHIIQKMQVRDRTQAAVLAMRYGWL
uniref:Oxygen sensor histidine kinase NreB n=1 Tax=Thermosporothrix sp. COM3 TaxID=2490863 RepID=A0A455SU27_9CHLR|nr:hypothetical protein KTC_43060 [Thermosporothrix sp. COM3]